MALLNGVLGEEKTTQFFCLVNPPEYHANPVSDKGSLVTVRWGYDITNYVFKESGLFTEVFFVDALELGIRAEYIEVLISRKI